MEISERFASINAKPSGATFKPHKPLLLLTALSWARLGKPRLASFEDYEETLKSFQDLFGNLAVIPPFGRLVFDGVWEVTEWETLERNSSGDLVKSNLVARNIHGGLKEEIYAQVVGNDAVVSNLARILLEKFFPFEYHEEIKKRLELTTDSVPSGLRHPRSERANTSAESGKADDSGDCEARIHRGNDFIAYLNSLHSIQASGANALAESQAVNPFFGNLYEPFPLADRLKDLLRDQVARVVILSGHAGDGKSTVALHVNKALRGLDAQAPLATPLCEREQIDLSSGPVTIVKDMSELSADQRQDSLREAFANGSGSWLIISNTGPLLNSLRQYAKDRGRPEVEDDLLGQLDLPLNAEHLEEHVLDGFEKPLVILNLSRFDNTELGAKLLGRLIHHPNWQGCEGCSIQTDCPIGLNRRALRDVGEMAEQRVRWLYRHISEYEQRLTLRQIVAQLAFSVTGGMNCGTARTEVEFSTASGIARGTDTLAEILFSEGFFGYRAGQPFPDSQGLRAIELAHRMHFGGPVSPAYDRVMQAQATDQWVELPESLQHLAATWRKARQSPSKRAALRRLLLLFGSARPGREVESDGFMDALLRSPGLRLLDASRQERRLALGRVEAGRLRDACLDVLRETFSGFTASQFESRDDHLYLTLRRPDRAVVQPTQLVVGSLSFRDFGLDYDPVARLPVLAYRRGRGDSDVALPLSLPLLDYILRRADGELGTALDPIHQAQLDGFQARLLSLEDARSHQEGEIAMLRADISGSVDVYSYLLDKDMNDKPQRLVKQR